MNTLRLFSVVVVVVAAAVAVVTAVDVRTTTTTTTTTNMFASTSTSASSLPTYCTLPPVANDGGVDNADLVFAQVVHRHGDRTPAVNVYGDARRQVATPWRCGLHALTSTTNSDAVHSVDGARRLYRQRHMLHRQTLEGNCGFGVLTEKGEQQHLTLGAAWRARYNGRFGLLRDTTAASVASQAWVRSTDVQRTRMSAQFNLLALFPPAPPSSSQCAASLVDVTTIDRDTDNLTPNTKLCPRLAERAAEIERSPAWQQHTRTVVEPLWRDVSSALRLSPSDTSGDLLGIWDHEMARRCSTTTAQGAGYSPGMTDELAERIGVVNTWSYVNSLLNSTELLQLSIGSFMQELIDNFVDFRAGSLTQRWMHYSAHDTSVLPIVEALGVWDGIWPPYASHIELELWRDRSSGALVVRTYYNGRLGVPRGCASSVCPLDTWIAGQAPIAVNASTFEQLCTVHDDAFHYRTVSPFHQRLSLFNHALSMNL